MNASHETVTEKIISPFLITVISFCGFMFYIYCYVKGIDSAYLTATPSAIAFLATLLMLRSKIRSIRKIPDNADTREANLERSQRRKDADAHYFGMIIFILAAIYIVFVELIPFV